jgi:hypothetical protein
MMQIPMVSKGNITGDVHQYKNTNGMMQIPMVSKGNTTEDLHQ